jgi:hypothetical protein
MNFCVFAMAPFLFLVGSSVGQDKSGRAVLHEFVAKERAQKILSTARLSGSLEFWSVCDIAKPHAPFLKIGPVSGHEGPSVEVLQEVFANDPQMRVTQDSDGKIRMVETDVPRDFLEVKIHHLSFPPDFRSKSGPMAVYFILNTPEVKDFMERNIGKKVPWFGWGMPGQIVTEGPSVPGELNDVTVEQALDYVSETFPGFWTYENCRDPEGSREISVGFRENIKAATATFIPAAK